MPEPIPVPTIVPVQLRRRGSRQPPRHRSVDLRACRRLPIGHQCDSLLGLNIITRWLIEHYGVGGVRDDVGLPDPIQPQPWPVERLRPVPHALHQDPTDGLVFVESRPAIGFAAAARTWRYYQVSPPVLRRYLIYAGYDEVTRAEWTGKLAAKGPQKPRDGRLTDRCEGIVNRAFDNFLSGGEGWPKIAQIVQEAGGECSEKPARAAYRRLYQSDKFRRWRRENPGAPRWGIRMKDLNP